MGEIIPLNPDILKWARETSGLNVEDVSIKMKKDVSAILDWESGNKTPTYVQSETLAYKVYNRPIALFFFPAPPLEETPRQSFRTLPINEISNITPRLLYIIRQARVMQINLAELNDNVNPAPQQILQDLQFKPNASVSDMADKIRGYLNIDLTKQGSWINSDEAFKAWRNALEER